MKFNEDFDPDADKVLQAMSSYLGGATAFSVNTDIDNEIITQEGQKLQLSSYATIIMERPASSPFQRRKAPECLKPYP